MARTARMIYDSSRVLDNFTNGTGAAVSVGDVAALSDKIGIWQQDVAIAGTGVVVCVGRWAFPLKTGDTPAEGARVYWDVSAQEITVTATDNIDAGLVVPGHDLAAGEVCVDIAM